MKDPFQPAEARRYQEAMRCFDAANALDPQQETEQGTAHPRELLYAERLTRWVLRLKPDASESLLLAARCQHIRRWEIPRTSFPGTREGYLQWKETLKRRHAEISGEILGNAGYPKETIERVQSLNLKRNLRQDEECQILEDALCLVFMEHQLPDLAARLEREKVLTALQKSWAKMSASGRSAALGLKLDAHSAELIQEALSQR